MACYSFVSYWCKWCMFIMLPCSQRALILVLEHVGNFSVRLPPACSHHGISVRCSCVQILNFYATRWPVLPTCMQLTLVSWYVASMLCCHCWMFSLGDALPMQSYPSKVWVLCQCGRADLCAAQFICFLPIYFSTWNPMGYTRAGSNPDRSARFCRGAGWGVREAGWKHEWRVTSQRLL